MLHGDNRKLITNVKDLKAELAIFKDKDQDILDAYSSIDSNPFVTDRSENGREGFKAVLLEFSLDKGSYATMLIREFFHFSSSFETQEQFNSGPVDENLDQEKLDEENFDDEITEN